METVRVRPFEPRDRAALRALAHRSGYMGEPATFYWRHAESFADVWTAWYMEHEPASLFVAVRGEEVVGYLSGCVDTHAAPSPAWAVTRAALRHGLFFRPGTAGFLWRGFADTVRERGAPTSARPVRGSLPRSPSGPAS